MSRDVRWSQVLLVAAVACGKPGDHSSIDAGGGSDAATSADGRDGADATVGDAGSIGTSGPRRLALSDAHTCYLDDHGQPFCWGADDAGQLGDGLTQSRSTAAAVTGLPASAIEITAGGVLLDGHTLARLATGAIVGWGANALGQLGDGTQSSPATFTSAGALDDTPASIVTSFSHSCALSTAGHIYCWGENDYGQLALPETTVHSLSPVAIGGLPANAVEVSVGSYHTCARLADSRVFCWGRNQFDQTGAVDLADQPAPVEVLGAGSTLVQLSAGYWHTCALADDGTIHCWGANSSGELGDGTTNTTPTPVAVTGLTAKVTAMCAGDSHSCALLETGGVQCWGWNDRGQLGDGTTTDRPSPVDVSGLASVVEIACGGEFTCARLAGGGVRCWGANYWGSLGDGTTQARSTPVAVQGL